MRESGWTWLVAAVTVFCLPGSSSSIAAAPASQPTARSQPARTQARFDLDPSGYSGGITSQDQYEQALANQLRDTSNGLAKRVGPDSDYTEESLRAAGFALIHAVEPDLTRIWLWRQPRAESQLAIRALALAGRALSEAQETARMATQSPDRVKNTSRIQMLRALSAMEEVLLTQADPTSALRAAELADSAMDKVPPEGQPTWNLLIAACLDGAGRREEALLRLQGILRQHTDSPAGLVAGMIQSRILAQAGNYPAAIALASEYLQALPTQGHGPATQPAARIVQCTFSLLKANLLREWADNLAPSTNQADRLTIGQLRDQCASWQAQAEESGPYRLRLMPLLRTLE